MKGDRILVECGVLWTHHTRPRTAADRAVGRWSTAVPMGKRGKRASSDGSSGGADASRRRSAGPTAPAETLLQQRVAGPAVLPPPGANGTGKGDKKRLELDLVSKRVYQETILRCGHQCLHARTATVVQATEASSVAFFGGRRYHRYHFYFTSAEVLCFLLRQL